MSPGAHSGATQPVRRMLPDGHHAAGLGYREGLQQYRVDNAEHGGIRADAERQRDGRDSAEQRVVAQRAEPDAQIADDVLGGEKAPDFAAVFKQEGGVSELAARLGEGGAGAHASLHQLVRLFLDVRFQFAGQFAVQAAAPENACDAAHDSEGLSTRLMPDSMRSKLDSSRWSCFRPAGVMR
jgi:hypothetical protein